MKHLFICSLMAMLLTLGAKNTAAQTSANFNSTNSITTSEVKATMQNNCWQFPDMDVNFASNDPIEGDGSIVSRQSANSQQNTGIYSPLLNINGPLSVSFTYKFSNNVIHRRWVKLYLTDEYNNNVQLLDSMECTGLRGETIYTYSKTFVPENGTYKLYINYRGENGAIRVAIDELNINANRLYANGCNQAPITADDNFQGSENYKASGNVLNNDREPDNEIINTSLLANSKDGTVDMKSNGDFTFTPNTNFKGTSTTFSYMACDKGHSPLCGQGNVTINFPSKAATILPVSIINFLAFTKNDDVTLNWTTTFEVNNDRFEILRSTDGQIFKTVGTIKSNGNSQQNVFYSFIDNTSNINTNKHDFYYKLKQVDKDGKESFSKVLVVRVYNTKTLQVVSVTPNPAINNIKVNVALNETSMVVMKVVNTSGFEMMRKSVKGATGNNSFELEGTNTLTPGVYFLEVIINSNERMMIKLLKN